MVIQDIILKIKTLLETNANSFDDKFSLKDDYQTMHKAKKK